MGRGFSPTTVPKEIRLQEYSCQSVYESWPSATEAVKISPDNREKLIGATNNCVKIRHFRCSNLAYHKSRQQNLIAKGWFLSNEFCYAINHTCCSKNARVRHNRFSICCLCDLLNRTRLGRISPYIYRAAVPHYMHPSPKDFTVLQLYAKFLVSKHAKNYQRLIKSM